MQNQVQAKQLQTEAESLHSENGILATYSPETKPHPQSEPTREVEPVNTYQNYEWYNFFPDSDNLYPQILNWLQRSSSTHRSILNTKASLTKGKKFRFYNLDRDEIQKEDLSNDASEFYKSPNSDVMVDLHELFLRAARHWCTHGNAYCWIKTAVQGAQRRYSVRMIEPSKCRLSTDDKSLLVSANWQEIKKDRHANHKKYAIMTLPLWNGGVTTTQNEFVIHMKREEMGYDHYGVPDYVASIRDAEIEYMVDNYNYNRLDNGHFSDVDITFVSSQVPDGTSYEEYLKTLMAPYIGHRQAGKPRGRLVKNPENKPHIHEFKQGREGEFLQLEESAYKGLIRGHRWYPSLGGIETPGKLGSNQQIRNEYELAMKNVIRPDYQEPLLRLFNTGLEIIDLDFRLGVFNEPPIGIEDRISPSSVMTLGEQRQEMGQPIDPDDERNDMYLWEVIGGDSEQMEEDA